jgi:coenzyme Q-binding protein COQ10
VVGFKSLKETFTSRVTKHRPEKIVVDYVDGPLKFLHNSWTFTPDGKGGTQIHFCVDFAFKSRIFEALAGQMFDRALRRMTAAFETRAHELYGDGSTGINSSSAHSAA